MRGKSWYLGETVINGIGQGYIQTTPLQLCLMTAQIANGGFKIKPHIIHNENINFQNAKLKISKQFINDTLLKSGHKRKPLEESFSFVKDYIKILKI